MLRPYQNGLVEEARLAFGEGHQRVLLQLPTGGGKTHILSEIARLSALKHLTVLAMAHRIEIVEQISERLTMFGLSPGAIAASIPYSESPTRTYVAMQQTLVKRLQAVPQPGLLIVDEAHHQAAKGYQTIAEAWPETKIIGLTATPCRLDGKPLREHFDKLVCGPTVRELIDMGALADYTYLAPAMDPQVIDDLKKVRKTAGDWNRNGLETVVNKRKIIGDVVSHYAQLLNGKPVIAFCVSVNHASEVCKAFTAAGYRASFVHGSMKREERDAIMNAFRSGAISVLVSCDLIGEGYDAPDCAGVLLLRPTASLSLFLQQCGRALRPKSDGSKAIILDHVGNCYRHGRPCDDREWSLDSKVKQQEVEIRQCQECFTVINPQASDFDCAIGSETCPVTTAPSAAKAIEDSIQYIDGELIEYVPPVNADWAGAIDLRSCTGREYQRLLRLAGTEMPKLEQIAKARNFKASWPYVRVKQVEAMRKKFGRTT